MRRVLCSNRQLGGGHSSGHTNMPSRRQVEYSSKPRKWSEKGCMQWSWHIMSWLKWRRPESSYHPILLAQFLDKLRSRFWARRMMLMAMYTMKISPWPRLGNRGTLRRSVLLTNLDINLDWSYELKTWTYRPLLLKFLARFPMPLELEFINRTLAKCAVASIKERPAIEDAK